MSIFRPTQYAFQSFAIFAVIFWVLIAAAEAQTTVITYQGKLTDGMSAANGTYDFGFALFDAPTGGAQIGPALTKPAVAVTNGIFTVQLDFGANPFQTNTARYLEISVKHPGDATYATLTPRQQLTSAPFAVQSISAQTADGLSAACVGCVTNAQIQNIDGAKITGAVASANTAATAGNVTGVVGIANGGTGSSTQNFVDLTTNQTIAGNKTFTGTLSGPSIDNARSILATASFAGYVSAIAGNASAYVFAGPTAIVSTSADQRLTGVANAALGLTSGGPATVRVSLCYQPAAGGEIISFVGFNYNLVEITTNRQNVGVSASVVPGAGTWRVGYCVYNSSPQSINDNEFVNGWVMVTR